jgi:hypothetical protein
MLEAPRELLARVLLALKPLDPPLKPLEREALEEGMSRPPIRLLELALGLVLRLAPALVRFAELALAPPVREALDPWKELLPELRLLAPRDCWVDETRLPPVPDWARLDADEPENLFAVDLLE